MTNTTNTEQAGWSLDLWRPSSLAPSQQRAVELGVWLLTGQLPDHQALVELPAVQVSTDS